MGDSASLGWGGATFLLDKWVAGSYPSNNDTVSSPERKKKARVTGHPQHSKDRVHLLRQSQRLYLPQFVRRHRHFLIRLQPWWSCRTLILLRICSRQDIDTVKGPCRPRVISIMDCQLIALDWVMLKTLLSYLLSHKATPLRQQLGRHFPSYKAVRLSYAAYNSTCYESSHQMELPVGVILTNHNEKFNSALHQLYVHTCAMLDIIYGIFLHICSWQWYIWSVWCSPHPLCEVVSPLFWSEIATCWRRSHCKDLQWWSRTMSKGSLEEVAAQELWPP